MLKNPSVRAVDSFWVDVFECFVSGRLENLMAFALFSVHVIQVLLWEVFFQVFFDLGRHIFYGSYEVPTISKTIWSFSKCLPRMRDSIWGEQDLWHVIPYRYWTHVCEYWIFHFIGTESKAHGWCCIERRYRPEILLTQTLQNSLLLKNGLWWNNLKQFFRIRSSCCSGVRLLFLVFMRICVIENPE